MSVQFDNVIVALAVLILSFFDCRVVNAANFAIASNNSPFFTFSDYRTSPDFVLLGTQKVIKTFCLKSDYSLYLYLKLYIIANLLHVNWQGKLTYISQKNLNNYQESFSVDFRDDITRISNIYSYYKINDLDLGSYVGITTGINVENDFGLPVSIFHVKKIYCMNK